MTIHALFPTLLLAEEDPNHSDRKPVYMRSLLKYLDSDGYSDESTGHVTIHLDPIFDPICQMATAMARQYCEVMRIDPSIFDFYIVKSWFNIIQNRATPFHSHADAHLSFCYYINVPEEFAQPIRFHANPNKYEPFPGFVKFNNPDEWNIFNSSSWQFPVSEGGMYLWPSAMCHDTIGNSSDRDPGVSSEEDAHKNRVTFAGDILLTYKEKSAKPMGLQPRRNWKSFNNM
jgi:hypothetical protein